jgi:hypothetical protein
MHSVDARCMHQHLEWILSIKEPQHCFIWFAVSEKMIPKKNNSHIQISQGLIRMFGFNLLVCHD